MNKGFL